MSNQEFEFIIEAVEFIASYGQRFLPLYRFDFKTGIWSFNSKLLLAKDHNVFGTKDVENGLIIKKHKSCLEFAVHIANSLPKFPKNHKIPQNVDPNLLYFRI